MQIHCLPISDLQAENLPERTKRKDHFHTQRRVLEWSFLLGWVYTENGPVDNEWGLSFTPADSLLSVR